MKTLILTADDFGRSTEINAAILRAHRAGCVTQASLMVHEPGVEEAVRLAQQHPALRIGLHLTLCAGRAAAPSPLTDARGHFPASPARAGLRYAFRPTLRAPLEREIRAQFERFRALGFPPTYWDGHAHLHLHPVILRLTLPIAREHGFRFTRLVREPGSPALLPAIFARLSRAAIPLLERHGVAFADHVFGLRTTGRMSTATFTRLLQNLPDGASEIYFHPGAEREDPDYDAVRRAIQNSSFIIHHFPHPPPAAR